MRRLLLLLLCLVLILSSCSNMRRTATQLKKEMKTYEDLFRQIAVSHQLEWVVTKKTRSSGQDGTSFYNSYKAKFSETEYIEIFLGGFISPDRVGVPGFSVSYILPSGENKEFDMALFVDFVNSAAEVVLTLDFCNEFIAAPQRQYSDRGNEPLGSLSYKAYYYRPWSSSGPTLTLAEFDDYQELVFGSGAREIPE